MKRILSVFLLLCFYFSVNAQSSTGYYSNVDKKVIEDFMDRRFGMFIHWGPVALKGTEIGWSRNKEVSKEEYDNLYKQFNPVLFDADAWVKTAKEAGMKYLTITAKHHDGFCLWPTKYTDYNIMNTPYKKDVVGALAKACKKYNIKFCIYYTVLDWYDTRYPLHNDGNKTPDSKADMPQFVQYMKDQLEELIIGYHPYMIWFDGNWEQPWTYEYGKEVYDFIKKMDARIIINNRIGKGTHEVLDKKSIGDFATPEQKIGRIDMLTPWESCITLCQQWAWKPNDQMKSLQQCIQTIAKTAGGNGNLLFNIGPMPDGKMEDRQLTRLLEIGSWMSKYGTSVYNTKGGPYQPSDVFASTRKGNKIFIHLFQRPSAELILLALQGITVKKAYFLGGGHVGWRQEREHIALSLPEVLSDDNDTVIVLEVDKDVERLPLL